MIKKKSILVSLVMLFCATFMVSAQETVMTKQKFLDNTYVSLYGLGSYTSDLDNFDWDNVGINFGLTVGKSLTPITSLQLSYGWNGTQDDKFKDFFKNHNIYGDVLFNLNNIIAGYPNHKRVVEVSLMAGTSYHFSNTYKGEFGARIGLPVDFNLSQDFALQLIPTWNFDKTFQTRNSSFGLGVGVKYTIGESFKVYEAYDLDYVNGLNETINSLRSDLNTANGQVQELESREMVTNVTEVVENVNVVNNVIDTPITFGIGSSNVENSQYVTLYNVAEFLKVSENAVEIRGYADANTGTDERNNYLSSERAQNVKEILVSFGVSEDNIIVKSFGATTQPFKENEWNRVVLIVTQ